MCVCVYTDAYTHVKTHTYLAVTMCQTVLSALYTLTYLIFTNNSLV
jgi:hypothetical protein